MNRQNIPNLQNILNKVVGTFQYIDFLLDYNLLYKRGNLYQNFDMLGKG